MKIGPPPPAPFPLLRLSDELLLHVLEFLSPLDQVSVRATNHRLDNVVESWPALVPAKVLQPWETRRKAWVRDFNSLRADRQREVVRAMKHAPDPARFASPVFNGYASLFPSKVYTTKSGQSHLIQKGSTTTASLEMPWFYVPAGTTTAGQLDGQSEFSSSARHKFCVFKHHQIKFMLPAENPDTLQLEDDRGNTETLTLLDTARADALLRTLTFKPVPSNYRPWFLAKLPDEQYLYCDKRTTGDSGRVTRVMLGRPFEMRMSRLSECWLNSSYNNGNVTEWTSIRTSFGEICGANDQLKNPNHKRQGAKPAIFIPRNDGHEIPLTLFSEADILTRLPRLGIDLDAGAAQQLRLPIEAASSEA